MIKAVIFDIDGTLLDSVNQHAQAWKEAFEHFNFDFPYDQIRFQIGKGGDEVLATFLDAEQTALLGTEIKEYRAELFKKQFLESCKPFPKVRELLESLRAQNLAIALASSAKKDEIEVYKKTLKIGDLVEHSVSSEDVQRSKPNPDAVAVAREKLGGLAPENCCFVGDSPHDAEAAKKDKTPMVGVLCGGFSEEDLRSAGAADIFRDPEDLLGRWKPSVR